MKLTEDKLKKIKDALAAAYFQKEEAGQNEMGKAGVMNRIRRLRPLSSDKGYLAYFEPFIWRLAPVACLLIIVLSFAIANTDPFFDTEMTMAFLEDPADFSLFSLFEG